MYPYQDLIQTVFGPVAARYEVAIVPVYRQLADAVIQTARPRGHEHALDIGTGTGVLARRLAPHVQSVVGIDLVPEMVAAAILAQHSLPNVTFQVADAHKLPFEDATFNLAVASFGLNATSPSRAFAEIYRILKEDGVLAFHEWSVRHSLDSLVVDVLAEYMLDDEDVSDELFRLREFTAAVRPWDNVLQEVEDFHEELAAVGFTAITVWEDTPVTCILTTAEFMAYQLAWTGRRMELAEMDEWRRGDCLDALRTALQDAADMDGNLHYDPMLFRVRAVR